MKSWLQYINSRPLAETVNPEDMLLVVQAGAVKQISKEVLESLLIPPREPRLSWGIDIPVVTDGQTEGDSHIRLSDGSVWQLIDGAWSAVGNLRGPEGPAGGIWSGVITVTTAEYDIADYDYIYMVDTDSTAIDCVVNLPVAAGKIGHRIYVQNTGHDGYKTILVAEDLETIAGHIRFELASGQGEGFFSDGADWYPSASDPQEQKFVHNVNATVFSVTHNANVTAQNYDKQILLFGDSHAWGQGASEWDWPFGTNYSSHSSSLFNQGFMARIEQHIRSTRGFDEMVYTIHGRPDQRILPYEFAAPDAQVDDFLSRPVKPSTGAIFGLDEYEIVPTISSYPAWFTPWARGANDLIDVYRDKLFRGRFNAGMFLMAPEDENSFLEAGKLEYITLLPCPGISGSGGSWSTVTDSNGTILGEYDGSEFYLRVNPKMASSTLGFFTETGQKLFVPGFGTVTVGTMLDSSGIKVIQILNASGSYPTGLEKWIHSGMRIYHNDYVKVTTAHLDPVLPFRRMYVCFRRGSSGSKLRFFMSDGAAGGAEVVAYSHNRYEADTPTLKPIWNFGRTEYPKVYGVTNTGALVLAGAEATVYDSYIEIDAYSSGLQDVIYCLDFGSKVWGRVHMELNAATGSGVAVRGVLFDNNNIANFAMGGHTIGQWMGDGASYNDAAHDHLADILSYIKTTPHLVITELPIVNEYLRQTPLAAFKSNIATFMSRLNAVLNSGGGKATDFLFFTTLGGKDVDYEGAGSSAVTYDQYVQAALTQCLASGAGLVDCRARFRDFVRRGGDYNRLYADNNHPSSFANEFIAKWLIEVIDQIL
ncbi:hypothetical protein [Geobacter sp. SVR]|uniref:hypothetical protein n=1 Tax=Geobacter sp. SVR TaxID=2495594 RepID=UPI00143F0170|nr:hypothetical protein [Geobacter sp. SVR]BCS54573.1 hypothetical protein GSVR_28810 [Geobacter sp. SVR]GCF86920.1 hypothetical protein GSbR_35200 [Geobacter sp. SVR]